VNTSHESFEVWRRAGRGRWIVGSFDLTHVTGLKTSCTIRQRESAAHLGYRCHRACDCGILARGWDEGRRVRL